MSDEQYDRAFVSFIDENGETKNGFFLNVVVTAGYIAFDTDKNRITIPWSRVLKVKGAKEGV